MSRRAVLAALLGFAAVLPGCYDVPIIPPRPSPVEIVQRNASAEIVREFAGTKAELRKELPKFLEKLGDAETSQQLMTAWTEVYPDYPRVVRRTISKSVNDTNWPVMGAESRVYVEGFRQAAQELSPS
jgi:hypothetical protein